MREVRQQGLLHGGLSMMMAKIASGFMVTVLWVCFVFLLRQANEEIRYNPERGRVMLYVVIGFFVFSVAASVACAILFLSANA